MGVASEMANDRDATPTPYEWAGGTESFERLTAAFYERVRADDLVGAHSLIEGGGEALEALRAAGPLVRGRGRVSVVGHLASHSHSRRARPGPGAARSPRPSARRSPSPGARSARRSSSAAG